MDDRRDISEGNVSRNASFLHNIFNNGSRCYNFANTTKMGSFSYIGGTSGVDILRSVSINMDDENFKEII